MGINTKKCQIVFESMSKIFLKSHLILTHLVASRLEWEMVTSHQIVFINLPTFQQFTNQSSNFGHPNHTTSKILLWAIHGSNLQTTILAF